MSTKVKTCFVCGNSKPLNDFYEHPAMKDGHLNKCKECTKTDVRTNRRRRINHYREYDRNRGARQGYSVTKMYRTRWPGKYKARNAVSNALRRGVLVRKPCEECGSEVSIHAHHDDYTKPLDVRWLCAPCHSAWHLEHGEAPGGDAA